MGFIKGIMNTFGLGDSRTPVPLVKGEIDVTRIGERIVAVVNSRGMLFNIPTSVKNPKLFYLERTDTHYILMNVVSKTAKLSKVHVLNLETGFQEDIEIVSSLIN